MAKPAIASRRFQFCAGPESTVFYACEEHAHRLSESRNPPICFLTITSEPVVAHDADDELCCDYCREG